MLTLQNMKTIIVDDIEYIIHKQDDNNLLLTPKYIYVKSLQDVSKHDFCKSKIISCTINNRMYDIKKYKPLLEKIYTIIDSGTKIIKKTLLNIDTKYRNDSGFYYIDELEISVQGVDSNKCIQEICNQSIINEIKLDIEIKLDDDKCIMIQM